jgi:uncharacterized protein YjbK
MWLDLRKALTGRPLHDILGTKYDRLQPTYVASADKERLQRWGYQDTADFGIRQYESALLLKVQASGVTGR